MKCIHIVKPNNNSPRGVIKATLSTGTGISTDRSSTSTVLGSSNNSTWRIIKGLCMVAFMVLTTIHCLTYLSGEAMAEEVGLTVNNTSTVLELNIPSTVNLNLIPTSGTAFNTVDLPIGVGTNNSTGYTLSMQATSSTLTRTSSIADGNNSVTTPTIPSITGTFSPADFESSNSTINKWGYKLSTDSTYGPITTSTIELASTNSAGNADTTTLNFVAKVDTTLPAGTYQTTFNFTAVTNVAETPVAYTVSLDGGLPCSKDTYSGDGSYFPGDSVSFTINSYKYLAFYMNEEFLSYGYSMTHNFTMPAQDVVFRFNIQANDPCPSGK